ncbi:MAG: thymidylate synthase [Elusimicrobiota bacterium]
MKSIHIIEDTLPMAWEKAVIECWEKGDGFRTQYDKDEDPESKDVVAMIHVLNPMKDPRIHKAIPCGINDLERYRNEVVLGVHDYLCDEDGNSTKWKYTYHSRLFAYTVGGRVVFHFDQIDKVVEMLKKCGFTRRAQAITWQPPRDMASDDPPCLNRLWFRINNNKLNMNIHIRSNDAYKAAFLNMYAFTELQKSVADRVGVEVGEYIHIADSFHIYGSYFDEFKGFLDSIENRSYEDRVCRTSDVQFLLVEGCDQLLSENLPSDIRQLIEKRKKQLSN